MNKFKEVILNHPIVILPLMPIIGIPMVICHAFDVITNNDGRVPSRMR
jgi:hypothetical protein